MADVRALEVATPGPLTSLQDSGRFGYGASGVAPSGAVDSFSLRAGNRLVGNLENNAGLEMTFAGPAVIALSKIAIALTGADMQPQINGISVPMWHSLVMEKGDRLSFKGVRSGLRTYLALGGGIVAEKVLGSRSTNLGTRFGGLFGRPIMKGDILSAHAPQLHLGTEGNTLSLSSIPVQSKDNTFRIIFGPQDQDFDTEVLAGFHRTTYRVTENLDRTGIRLKGTGVREKRGLKPSIISEGVVSGAIQIPGDGQPIIILNETVTGGYRKIATVITADLHRLGQLRPMDTVRFVPVSLKEAQNALEVMERVIGSIK